MSFELNKLICAVLSAFLVYLLASFLSELLYHKDTKKIKLSYYTETTPQDNVDLTNEKILEKTKILNKNEINKLLENASFEKGESFIKKNCASCHDYSLPIKNKIGPSLATILNREVGSLKDYKYSKTFVDLKKNWDVVNLYYFLEKPKEWAKGTKMSYRGITDTKKLLNTIKYLRDNSLSNEN